MPYFLIIAVVVIIVISNIVKVKKRREDAENAAKKTPSPYSRTTTTLDRNLSGNTGYARETNDSTSTINSYSMRNLGYNTNKNSPKLTREEKLRLREEMKALYDAGIMDHDEYQTQISELR